MAKKTVISAARIRQDGQWLSAALPPLGYELDRDSLAYTLALVAGDAHLALDPHFRGRVELKSFYEPGGWEAWRRWAMGEDACD